VILKGLISLAEVLAGIAILLIPPSLVLLGAQWLIGLTPPSVSAHLVTEVAKYTSATARFLSIYLLTRGLIKVILIWALLKNKLWAYPASLIVLAGFVAYQLYQIFMTHSFLVVGVTIFDLIVMYFIWREYRIVQARRASHT
jgi:uncharacterized membrane protein